jgi:predicted GH43/DUF377 family glycosyl hydrolase
MNCHIGLFYDMSKNLWRKRENEFHLDETKCALFPKKWNPWKFTLVKPIQTPRAAHPHCFLEFKSEEKSSVCGETLPAEIIAFE